MDPNNRGGIQKKSPTTTTTSTITHQHQDHHRHHHASPPLPRLTPTTNTNKTTKLKDSKESGHTAIAFRRSSHEEYTHKPTIEPKLRCQTASPRKQTATQNISIGRRNTTTKHGQRRQFEAESQPKSEKCSCRWHGENVCRRSKQPTPLTCGTDPIEADLSNKITKTSTKPESMWDTQRKKVDIYPKPPKNQATSTTTHRVWPSESWWQHHQTVTQKLKQPKKKKKKPKRWRPTETKQQSTTPKPQKGFTTKQTTKK